jgi:hypothetical protein
MSLPRVRGPNRGCGAAADSVRSMAMSTTMLPALQTPKPMIVVDIHPCFAQESLTNWRRNARTHARALRTAMSRPSAPMATASPSRACVTASLAQTTMNAKAATARMATVARMETVAALRNTARASTDPSHGAPILQAARGRGRNRPVRKTPADRQRPTTIPHAQAIKWLGAALKLRT